MGGITGRQSKSSAMEKEERGVVVGQQDKSGAKEEKKW